jgi:uncharacterized membrane protein
MRLLTVALLLLISSTYCMGAQISGKVYDFTLVPALGAIVAVNTSPRQQYIAADASYGFDLARGSYILTAKSYQDNRLVASAEEILNVSDDGSYVVDLILFPALEDENLYYDLEFNMTDEYKEPAVQVQEKGDTRILVIMLVCAILIAVGVAAYLLSRKKKARRASDKSDIAESEESIESIDSEKTEVSDDDVANKVYDLIRQRKRLTQKEIRREVPFSEAKISLVLTELEANGKIQKIKKGRGNIIIAK